MFQALRVRRLQGGSHTTGKKQWYGVSACFYCGKWPSSHQSQYHHSFPISFSVLPLLYLYLLLLLNGINGINGNVLKRLYNFNPVKYHIWYSPSVLFCRLLEKMLFNGISGMALKRRGKW